MELITDSLQHEREKNNHPKPVSPSETRAIEKWERSEERPSEGDERGEGEFPLSSGGIDEHLSLCFVGPEAEYQGIGPLYKHEEDQQCPQERDEEPPILLHKIVCHNFRIKRLLLSLSISGRNGTILFTLKTGLIKKSLFGLTKGICTPIDEIVVSWKYIDEFIL